MKASQEWKTGHGLQANASMASKSFLIWLMLLRSVSFPTPLCLKAFTEVILNSWSCSVLVPMLLPISVTFLKLFCLNRFPFPPKQFFVLFHDWFQIVSLWEAILRCQDKSGTFLCCSISSQKSYFGMDYVTLKFWFFFLSLLMDCHLHKAGILTSLGMESLVLHLWLAPSICAC